MADRSIEDGRAVSEAPLRVAERAAGAGDGDGFDDLYNLFVDFSEGDPTEKWLAACELSFALSKMLGEGGELASAVYGVLLEHPGALEVLAARAGLVVPGELSGSIVAITVGFPRQAALLLEMAYQAWEAKVGDSLALDEELMDLEVEEELTDLDDWVEAFDV